MSLFDFDEAGRIKIPSGVRKERELDKDTFILTIRDVDYFFDKEGKERFQKEFNLKGQAYLSKKEYLVRRKDGKKEYFHRWLMQRELEDYCNENNLEEKDVEVHHLNNNKDNRREFLICMPKKKHRDFHSLERAWKEYKARMMKYWREGKSEDYYKECFERFWVVHQKSNKP